MIKRKVFFEEYDLWDGAGEEIISVERGRNEILIQSQINAWRVHNPLVKIINIQWEEHSPGRWLDNPYWEEAVVNYEI
jgi:hypothetical protein